MSFQTRDVAGREFFDLDPALELHGQGEPSDHRDGRAYHLVWCLLAATPGLILYAVLLPCIDTLCNASAVWCMVVGRLWRTP